MYKLLLASILVLLQASLFATRLTVKDNEDFKLTLSQNNYSRLFIKDDEIWDFAYPDNALALKRDSNDGSVYLMPASSAPFTLFLTTRTGRHFSATVNAEDSLGKTIELVPGARIATNTSAHQAKPKENSASNAIVSLISAMQRHEPLPGVSVKRAFGRAERSGRLTLMPKEYWEEGGLKGEIIEIYNGNKEPVELSESWFAKENVKAIKLSKISLAPKERATLYRVSEEHHG